VITQSEFCDVLQALTRSLPRFKPWDETAMALAWMTFPERAKRELTREMWLYAAAQRRLDPAPSNDIPIDLQLLQYVYRQRDGQACIDWGLKADLPERMANAGRFHPQPVHGQLAAEDHSPVSNPLLLTLARNGTDF
jgi:hypothetical protein